MGGRGDPGPLVHCQADVAVPASAPLACVQAHAGADSSRGGPGVLGESDLRSQGHRHRLPGICEDGK